MWPWAVGVAILGIVIARTPIAAFRVALDEGAHASLAAVNVAIAISVLCSDTLATWIGLVTMRMRRPIGDVMAVRGASFALFVLNYAVGQSAFGYYLHKSGASTLRATGATLFLVGTNLAALLLLTALVSAVSPSGIADPHFVIVVDGACVALVAYLAVIALAPAAFARLEIFKPLFDAGARGHAIAILARVPHELVLVLGQWAALRVWGIEVPLGVGLVTMPFVIIASVLPISPAGLGTTQAALVFMYSSYAVGSTVAEQQGAVLAFAVVHFVYGVIAQLALGFAYLPIARRRGVLREPTTAKA
jgi:hypothetical protein